MKAFDNNDMENNDNNQWFAGIINNNDHFKHNNKASTIASAPPFPPPYILGQTIIHSNDINQTAYVTSITLSRLPTPNSTCKSNINTLISLTKTSDIVDDTTNGMVLHRHALQFDTEWSTANIQYPPVASVLNSLPPSQVHSESIGYNDNSLW